jgi:hypothetical protein
MAYGSDFMIAWVVAALGVLFAVGVLVGAIGLASVVYHLLLKAESAPRRFPDLPRDQSLNVLELRPVVVIEPRRAAANDELRGKRPCGPCERVRALARRARAFF